MPTGRFFRLLRHLDDGRWHTLHELVKVLDVPPHVVASMVSFLSKYGFACYDRERGAVKISPLTNSLKARRKLDKGSVKTC